MAQLPQDVQDLLTLTVDVPPGPALADAMGELREREPAAGREVGEYLRVTGETVSYDPTALVWQLDITGHDSSVSYGTFTVSLTGTDVKGIGAEPYAVGLEMALNHPGDVPDAVYERYSQLTGWKGLSCDHCESRWPTWTAAVEHERDAHDVPIPA